MEKKENRRLDPNTGSMASGRAWRIKKNITCKIQWKPLAPSKGVLEYFGFGGFIAVLNKGEPDGISYSGNWIDLFIGM